MAVTQMGEETTRLCLIDGQLYRARSRQVTHYESVKITDEVRAEARAQWEREGRGSDPPYELPCDWLIQLDKAVKHG